MVFAFLVNIKDLSTIITEIASISNYDFLKKLHLLTKFLGTWHV